MQNSQALEELRWKKFPVLSDGFVTLVDVMGDDQSVVQAARVCYGNDNPKIPCKECDGTGWVDGPCEGRGGGSHEVCDKCCPSENPGFLNKKGKPWKENDPKDDRTLIRYLMRHHHTTPFEMAEIKILVRVPMDCWRQWIRHRTASVNEYSTRYTEAIDSMDTTPADYWRPQSETNKQGSDENFHIHLNTGEELSIEEEEFHQKAREVYQHRLKCGVAREQARKDLPLSTYTEAYWKIDLKNLLGFLRLRMDGHAQKEIRDYATTIGEQIVKPLFPMVWEAFEDYQLNSMELTSLDILMIQRVRASIYGEQFSLSKDLPFDFEIWPEEWRGLTKCRERDECIAKLKKLGLITN